MSSDPAQTHSSSPSEPPQSALPWLLILLGWLLVLGVMTVVVVIAVRNAPQSVPLDPPAPALHGR